MVVTAGKRLKSENGASLVAALLFFVLCGVAASMILAAASASAGKIVNLQAKCHFFLSKIGTSSTLKTLKIP